MQNENIICNLPREQIIDRTIFRIAREYTQQRSLEAAFVQYIKDLQATGDGYES